MMQSCASAGSYEATDPFLQGARSQAYGQDRNYQGAFSVLYSLCRTQNDAVQGTISLPYEPPTDDQKLGRQGHDHGLASATGVHVAGSNHCAKALFFWNFEQPPRQLNDPSSNPSIARTGQPFFAAFPPALVRPVTSSAEENRTSSRRRACGQELAARGD